MDKTNNPDKFFQIAFAVTLIAGMYALSRYNYIVFHSMAELFSIVIASATFMLAWNSRRQIENNFIIFIGIAYLFIAILDSIHMLSYKGMPGFNAFGANLPTQLWIAARYLESISMLAALMLANRHIRPNHIFGAYSLITTLVLLSIFRWEIFPVSYIEGAGLTMFKKVSEYIIGLILIAALYVLHTRRRDYFHNRIFRLLSTSVALTIAAELCFTLYDDVYGLFNLSGHILKLTSFYLIYLAIVKSGFEEPFSHMSENLRKQQTQLRKERDRAREYLDIAGSIIIAIDKDQKVQLINKKGSTLLGWDESEIVGKNWFDNFIPAQTRGEVASAFNSLMDNNLEPVEFFENTVLTRTGEEKLISWHNTVYRDKHGEIEYVLSSGEDITGRRRAENALMEQAAQYRDLVELSDAIHWELDLTTNKFTYIGQQAEKTLGYPVEQWVDFDFWASKIHSSDRTWAINFCMQHTARREDHIFTYRMLHKDGRTVWLRDMVKVISGQDGPVRLQGIMFDITQQKEIEEALRHSDNINRAILDNMMESICIINVDNFTIEAVNQAFLNEYNIKEDDAIGKTCHHVTHRLEVPCSAPDDICPLRNAIKDNAPVTLEHTHFLNDGTKAFIEVTTVPIAEPDGRIRQAVHISKDITERRQEEARILERNRFLQVLLDTIPNPVFYKDAEGIYLGCNSAFEKFLNLPKDQIIGHSVFDLAPHDLAQTYQKMDQELLDNPGVQIYESNVVSSSAQEHHVIFNKATFSMADGSVGGLVGIIVDITERKHMEKALRQSITDKDMLIKEIHHRVKNNLMVVQSLLRLQSHEITDKRAKGKFDESQNRIRAMSMIHERLYLSEDLKSVEMGEYIRSLAVQLAQNYRVQNSRVELRTDIDKVPMDIDTMIPCGLIINELISNAFKYAFPDDSAGEIFVKLKDAGDDSLIMSVSDNGVGLPQGLDIERAASLGLQLVTSLTKQIKGNLDINRVGGAEFIISFRKKEI